MGFAAKEPQSNFSLGRPTSRRTTSSPVEKKEAQIRYRSGVKLLIFVAVIFNILLAFVLVAYYNRGTTRRLKALVANTRQLAANKPLNAPIKGDNDEIAELDSTFRSMAAALAEALRKERVSDPKV
jgi:methyl-accepting chemotaxis protein